MHNDFSGPTLKLEFEFQLGRRRKIRTFRSVHPSLPFSETAALEAAMQSRSLEQAAGTGQQSRYPQPATSSSAPPPHAPSAPPSLPPPATGAAAAAREPPKGCCRAPRPTGSPHILPGSEVTDICEPSGPRWCRAFAHTQRCPLCNVPILRLP